MRQNELKYLKDVYENNFEIGDGEKRIDEGTYEVDKAYDSSGIVFLSEWFFDEEVHQYTKIQKDLFLSKEIIPTQYNFPDSNQELNSKIKEFHIKEGFECHDSEIFITEGSTPMIASIVIYAKALGFTRIYSVTPLYFTIFKVAELVNIPITPLNQRLTLLDYHIDLPKEKSILFITDPIWSVGRHHPREIIKQLRHWQEETGSLIFVDGSFSYTDWFTKQKTEQAALLNPDLTFRLICPTKTLCLNGLRFSYLICPKEFKRELSRITCSTIGSSSYDSHIVRPYVFNKMIRNRINPVGAFSRYRFDLIRNLFDERGIDYFKPDCGFFMFVNIENYLKKNRLYDKYMWIPNKGLDIFDKDLTGYAKLNLIMREQSFNTLLSDLRGHD